MKSASTVSSDNSSYRFSLIAIVTTDNDYKLSWKLNQTLNISLVKHDPLKIKSTRHPVDLLFSFYLYENEDDMLQFGLFSNKCADGLLIEEYKNADYIFKISDSSDKDHIDRIFLKIKTIQNILAVFLIDNNNVKRKTLDRFLF